ncbi:glycosyltransferase family 1 protein [Conidiobolus coronatus NRRL 28638]|uniref:Glycosyltransferase family 1 protein n=1 Tax=Conidiobolus coronatus (strain ATCC 28846 / CBS 209.66 / NRRL 28638) TaxID=796925 RepID=A0A137NVQ0_CONC2|nr:glycosyltransferase family 1 protein [Conidiobolus coronatus NRRL 28638]|eukprot:KXN66852.1 glycosyltransferase family 1 protein [Conidiobolus coronatus NRRL 28638]
MTFGSRSHVKYALEIVQDFGKRGHRVTYLSMDEMKKFGNGYNLTHYSLGDVKMIFNGEKELKPYVRGDGYFDNVYGIRDDLANLYKESFPAYERFYREEKPDLMICDFLANSCVESAAKHSIPMIIGYQSLMSTYSSPYLVGTGALEPTTIENHTFLQRMKHAFYDPVAQLLGALPVMDKVQEEKNKQGIPPIYSMPILGHMGIGIANSYVGLENARSIPSHIFPVGPIQSHDSLDLPEDLQSFMDNHGKVLYIAFGTMIRLPQGEIAKFLEIFHRAINEGVLDGIVWGMPKNDLKYLPKFYTVDSNEYSTARIIEGTHDNIKVLNWAPQKSILNHKNTKIFISHGGLDSIYESMDAGVPMMLIPFYADQPRNAMLVTENGVGDYIEWGVNSDSEIIQKFAKFSDSNNLEVKAKMTQMQLITKFSAKRKSMAADLVETYAYSARSCRQFSTPKPFEAPCEVLPFLPLDKRISSIKANLIDVYIAGFLIFTAVLISIIYITYYSSKRLLKYFKHKPKQE